MLAALVQAAPPPIAGWIPPAIAVSLIVIAGVLVSVLAGALVAIRRVDRRAELIGADLTALRGELAAMMEGARELAARSSTLVAMVEEEGVAYLDASRRFRRRLEYGVDRMTERMADLDALADVVQEEVEDSAIQIATVLRTARLSTGIISKVLRRRRRR